jgi:hypothetical protein
MRFGVQVNAYRTGVATVEAIADPVDPDRM